MTFKADISAYPLEVKLFQDFIASGETELTLDYFAQDAQNLVRQVHKLNHIKQRMTGSIPELKLVSVRREKDEFNKDTGKVVIYQNTPTISIGGKELELD